MSLVAQLDDWKRLRPGDPAALEALLEALDLEQITDAASLIRLHESLLFLRAYPHSARVARLADRLLSRFSARTAAVRDDAEAFEEAEVSGIAGTSVSAVYSYETARSLSARYGKEIDINWEWCEDLSRAGPVVAAMERAAGEEWPVEAHMPVREWVESLKKPSETALQWFLRKLAALPCTEKQRAELFERMNLLLEWRLGDSPAARSHTRLAGRRIFPHPQPLIARRDVSLWQELTAPPLPVRKLPAREARSLFDLIVDTSAVRYRELYGFQHPDPRRVWLAQAGRGVEIALFGVLPEWRLPLRAYHGGMIFKNGVPAGYVELLSLFERAEVGFNLYYTFREGETAWIYARLLRLCRQLLGVTHYYLDPYQIGHENDEAIESGAFWFYRKLGFRSVDADLRRLTEAEERRLAAKPGSRTSERTLRKLASHPMLYEPPASRSGEWDRFHIRRLALARWPAWARREFETLNTVKHGPDEARYLRLMQEHEALRAELIRLGSVY